MFFREGEGEGTGAPRTDYILDPQLTTCLDTGKYKSRKCYKVCESPFDETVIGLCGDRSSSFRLEVKFVLVL